MEVSENVDPLEGPPIDREAWTSRPGRVLPRCFKKQGGWWERSRYRRVVYVTGRSLGVRTGLLAATKRTVGLSAPRKIDAVQ